MIKLTDILPGSNQKVYRLHLIMTMLFLVLFAFPLFPLKFTNLIFMVISALTLLAFFIKPFPIGRPLLRNLVFVIPFVPYLIEFLISGFHPTAHFEFEKKLFFFTAPLIIPVFMKVTGFRNYKLALLVFALSVGALTIFTTGVLIIKGVPFLAASYQNGAFILRDSFERISGLHPTYYSLFAISSVCFLGYASFSAKRWLRLCFVILAVMLFITVLFLAVRIAFITAAILLLIMIIKNSMSVLRKLLFGFCAFALLALISFALPSLRNRLSEMVALKNDYNGTSNTVSQRATILHCSLQVFSENILPGTGSRNFQQKLNDCYSSAGFPVSDKQSFNPHNQYLSIGINYGIFVMLLFIACLFMIFRKIIKIPEGIYFGTTVLVFFLSESILERQMGVYFFGLVGLLLYNLDGEPLNEF